MDAAELMHKTAPAVHKTGQSRHKTGRAARIPITARELVEWTYAEQQADRGGIPEGGGVNISQTGIVVDRLLAFASLGCQVDVSSKIGAVWGETRCHEDALTVHAAVGELCWRYQQLLITHGRSRSAPDWSPKIFPLSCRPAPGKLGRPKGIYAKSGNKHIGSELIFDGDWPDAGFALRARQAAEANRQLWGQHNWQDEPFRRCADVVIERAREQYSEWCEALEALHDCLDYSRYHILSRYRINGLGAPRWPWRA